VARRPSITVRIFGQDYRIASEGGAAAEEQVHSAASLVDDTMRKIRDRTGTVDTLGLAVLTALNLSNRYLGERDEPGAPAAGERVDSERVRALIDLVEAAASEVPGAA
jgi:cell division protein ZapA (FtsZ GTPase activity inhibitor)